jgi:hypothetical protein
MKQIKPPLSLAGVLGSVMHSQMAQASVNYSLDYHPAHVINSQTYHFQTSSSQVFVPSHNVL